MIRFINYYYFSLKTSKRSLEWRIVLLTQLNPIVYGIGFAIIASALQNFGMGFQKVGMERLKAISSENTISQKIRQSKIWIIGTGMTFFSWGFFLAALTYIGISIVQPILIGGIVFLVVFAIIFLEERTVTMEKLGIASTVLGAVLIALEAETINRNDYSWEISTLIIFSITMLSLSIAFLLHSYFILHKSPLASGGAVSGILTGQGAIFARSLTLEENNPIFFLISVHFWLLVVFQVASFVILQAAFHQERAITIVPIYSSFAVLVPLLASIFVFSENVGLLLYIGIIFILIGVLLLSRIGAEIIGPGKINQN